MSDRGIAISPSSFSPAVTPAVAVTPVANRPMAARTKLLLEGRVLPTLLRLSAPNVLNLLAIGGMITFDGLFVGRLGPDALAGVSLAFPFVMLIQHTGASGMGGGVSSAIARALGAGKRDVADALVLHTFTWPLALQRRSRRRCCSARPSSFDRWGDMVKCWRLRSPMPT